MPKKDTRDLSKEISQLVVNPIGLTDDCDIGMTYWNERAEVFRNKVTDLLYDNTLAGDVDEHLLDCMVRSYRRLIELNHEALVGGMVIDSPHGKKANPAIASLQAEERIFHNYLKDFGLTPMSRSNRDGAVSTKPLHGNHKQSNILKIIGN